MELLMAIAILVGTFLLAFFEYLVLPFAVLVATVFLAAAVRARHKRKRTIHIPVVFK